MYTQTALFFLPNDLRPSLQAETYAAFDLKKSNVCRNICLSMYVKKNTTKRTSKEAQFMRATTKLLREI